ncbi:MAG TPA: winged helix-turn-helix domain-containing protein [Acidimicrobiia bacterium]|nr:winged helix-turn-helix domain-containing protein [Acidimicrobiia bacterium]
MRTSTVDDVVTLQWPEDRVRLDELAAHDMPRLLLVAPGAEPPEHRDERSDWMRLPAEGSEVRARVDALRRRLEHPGEPYLDSFGVLHRGERWVSLPPIEERIADLLVVRAGRVVGRRTLARAAWPEGVPNDRAMDSRMMLLRRRVAPLGLRIHTVRRQGFLLEIDPR